MEIDVGNTGMGSYSGGKRVLSTLNTAQRRGCYSPGWVVSADGK
jgi:hypothetical protein